MKNGHCLHCAKGFTAEQWKKQQKKLKENLKMSDTGIPQEDARKMVGKGWQGLIDICYSLLREGEFVTDVKEKFGELRIEYSDIRIEEEMDLITKWSTQICEICGKKGRLKETNGWLKTRCEEHAKNGEWEFDPIVISYRGRFIDAYYCKRSCVNE